jgi:ABC-type branched-subunit amino acid transport system permease subunit
MLVAPGKNAVTGATKGLFFFTAIFYLLGGIIMFISLKDPLIILQYVGLFIVITLGALLLISLFNLIFKIPRPVKKALFICLPLLFYFYV